MRWAGHVTCMGSLELHTKIHMESLKGGDRAEDLDRRVILKWTLGKRIWGCKLDSYGSAQGVVADYCENSNEPLAFVEGEEFLD